MNAPICNIEVEQGLIGTILANNEAVTMVSEIVGPEHFFESIHQITFEVAAEMFRKGQKFNPITIKTFLPEKIDNLRIDGQKATVAQYLARLAIAAEPLAMVPTYAKLIYDLAIRRRIVSVAEGIAQEARNLDVDIDPKELGENGIAGLSDAIADNDGVYGATTFGDAVDGAMADTGAAYSSKRTIGLSYRFPPMEKLIGALSPGQLIILGAATKQGKSALAGQLAMGAALEGHPVWFYSGEMSAKELAMRESSRETKVSVNRQKRGKITESDFERIVQFRNERRDVPFFIQEKRLTLDSLSERAKHFVRKKGKGLIVVDHILLVDRGRGQRQMADWEFGQEVTLALKQLARDIDCPVVACAQLKKNTFVDNRAPLTEKFLHQIVARRPRYTDLIGAMERDADHVIMPFRPVVFLKEHEPPAHSDLAIKWQEMVEEHERQAKIVLALSRESQWPRDVDCGWDGATTTFFEIGSANDDEMPALAIGDNPMRLF